MTTDHLILASSSNVIIYRYTLDLLVYLYSIWCSYHHTSLTMDSLNRALLALLLVLQCSSSFVVGFSPSIHKIYNGQQYRSSGVLQSTSTAISTPDTTATNEDTALSKNNSDKVNELATKLINKCKEYGQIGSKLTEEQQTIIDELAEALIPYSDSGPAQVDLQGRHDLIYSASPGASSGALGPFVGSVSQSFLDEERFINRVEIGEYVLYDMYFCIE